MGKAQLRKEGRDALDQIKILFMRTQSSQNTKALGEHLKMFAADYTRGINDDERRLLFDIGV